MDAKWSCVFIGCLISLLKIQETAAKNAHVPAKSDVLVVGLARGLSLVNLTSLTSHYALTNTTHVFDVDVHRTQNSTDVYWSDYEEGKIYSAVLENGVFNKVSTFVEAGLTTVEGIAVDWMAKNLYWVESRSSMIEVASLANSQFRKILISNLKSPRALAVDPNVGLMFWSGVSDTEPGIFRSLMDGTDHKQLVQINKIKDGEWPNGITLDSKTATIYWTDAKSLAIYSASYDGDNMIELFQSHEAIRWPFAIVFLNGNLFWADASLSKVSMIAANGSSDAQVVYRAVDWIYGTAVIPANDTNWQLASLSNPCNLNGGCSHICLLRGKTQRTCACPFLMELKPDGRTCDTRNEVLVTLIRRDSTLTNEIVVTTLDSKYRQLLPVVAAVTRFKIHFDIDIERCLVYWTDGNDLWENSCGAGKKILIHGRIGNIAVDQHEGTVFYVSLENPSTILAYSANGVINSAVSLPNGTEITSLICITSLRKLIWVSSNDNMTSIQSSNFNGADLTVLYRKECDTGCECVSDLSSSGDLSFIYWLETSANESRIIVQELDAVSESNYEPIAQNIYLINSSDTCFINNKREVQCLEKAPNTSTSQPLFEVVGHASIRIVSRGVNLIRNEAAKPESLMMMMMKIPWCNESCANGAKCVQNTRDQNSNHSCQCTDGFTGIRCETPICSQNCSNGECVRDSKGKTVCVCKAGYSGDGCKSWVCDGYCLNYGDCVVSADGRPSCKCQEGWNGDRCEKEDVISDCKECFNGGKCISMDNVVYCICDKNFLGDKCERSFDVVYISFIISLALCITMLMIIIFMLRKRVCVSKRYRICNIPLKMQEFQNSDDAIIPESYECRNEIVHNKVRTFMFNNNSAAKGYGHPTLKCMKNYTEDKTSLICNEEFPRGAAACLNNYDSQQAN